MHGQSFFGGSLTGGLEIDRSLGFDRAAYIGPFCCIIFGPAGGHLFFFFFFFFKTQYSYAALIVGP